MYDDPEVEALIRAFDSDLTGPEHERAYREFVRRGASAVPRLIIALKGGLGRRYGASRALATIATQMFPPLAEDIRHQMVVAVHEALAYETEHSPGPLEQQVILCLQRALHNLNTFQDPQRVARFATTNKSEPDSSTPSLPTPTLPSPGKPVPFTPTTTAVRSSSHASPAPTELEKQGTEEHGEHKRPNQRHPSGSSTSQDIDEPVQEYPRLVADSRRVNRQLACRRIVDAVRIPRGLAADLLGVICFLLVTVAGQFWWGRLLPAFMAGISVFFVVYVWGWMYLTKPADEMLQGAAVHLSLLLLVMKPRWEQHQAALRVQRELAIARRKAEVQARRAAKEEARKERLRQQAAEAATQRDASQKQRTAKVRAVWLLTTATDSIGIRFQQILRSRPADLTIPDGLMIQCLRIRGGMSRTEVEELFAKDARALGCTNFFSKLVRGTEQSVEDMLYVGYT